MIQKYYNCLRLNLKVLRLALAKRWLGQGEFAASYDDLSEHYDQNWLIHLKPVTDTLLSQLSDIGSRPILDLGCGTGYTTAFLEDKYPNNKIVAVDISEGMLLQARNKCKHSDFVCDDILNFLQSQADQSASLIVSAWAIGYSVPEKVIQEAARVLEPGGMFAFVVNYADTLAPVFNAFRQCMQRYPEAVELALWPTFPSSWPQVKGFLERSNIKVCWHEDNRIAVKERIEPTEKVLPWLLKTGVIAGFDRVLPLKDNQVIADDFEAFIHQQQQPIEHHYISVTGKVNK